MTATLIQSPDRVVLQNISWQTYRSLVTDFEPEPAIRLTYDRGTLEIRMPLDPHETFKKLLGRLIEAATEELGLEIRSLGSRTCDREDLAKGLEPDQCYLGTQLWLCMDAQEELLGIAFGPVGGKQHIGETKYGTQ